MFYELRLRPRALNNKMLFPNEARHIVSKACVSSGLSTRIDPLLFQRDGAGNTLSYRWGRAGHSADRDAGYGACPAVIFGAAKGVIRVYGIGRHGATLVREHTPLLHQAICHHYDDVDVALEHQQSRCLLYPQVDTATIYSVRRMVLAKSLHQIKSLFPNGAVPDLDALRPLITRAIYGGLVSQVRLLDQSRSEQAAVRSEHYLPGPEELELDVLASGPAQLKSVKPGVLAIVLDGLTFAMRLNLQGPWFAGHLRSHGYGMLRKGVAR